MQVQPTSEVFVNSLLKKVQKDQQREEQTHKGKNDNIGSGAADSASDLDPQKVLEDWIQSVNEIKEKRQAALRDASQAPLLEKLDPETERLIDSALSAGHDLIKEIIKEEFTKGFQAYTESLTSYWNIGATDPNERTSGQKQKFSRHTLKKAVLMRSEEAVLNGAKIEVGKAFEKTEDTKKAFAFGEHEYRGWYSYFSPLRKKLEERGRNRLFPIDTYYDKEKRKGDYKRLCLFFRQERAIRCGQTLRDCVLQGGNLETDEHFQKAKKDLLNAYRPISEASDKPLNLDDLIQNTIQAIKAEKIKE